MTAIDPKTFETNIQLTWCPGCGNYGIWMALKSAILKLGIPSHKVVVVYGVGCHGNMRDWMGVYGVEELHGRAIPFAQGVKMSNTDLTVIAVVGDGDSMGEGGNHFIHAAKRNPNITVLVHDNQVYGLTTGQAAPTAQKGFVTKSTPTGVIDEPINPVSLALTVGGTFAARSFAGDIPHLSETIATAITHKGFSVVDVLQPCVTFDKIHTYQWYRDRIYKLDASYDAKDKKIAREKMFEWGEKIPVGVIYQETKPTSEEIEGALEHGPLYGQSLDFQKREELLSIFR